MSVVAAIAVVQWADALVAATRIDDRTWLDHLVTRMRRASCVTRVAVVCHPGCARVLDGVLPDTVTLAVAEDPHAWGADVPEDLVARVPVTQLFVDPVALDRLAAVPRAPHVQRVHAVLPQAGLDLTGGAYVDLLTPHGCGVAARGESWPDAAWLGVPADPEPPEQRLRSAAEAGWGVTVQRALLAHDGARDLTALDAVLTAARLRRFAFWPDGVGRGPARVLTVRCQPAPLFSRLMRHLAHLPNATVDVVCSAALAADTAGTPGVSGVMPFDGPSFDLERLGPAWADGVRAQRYDLCVLPRRTADGHGFANVTALGAASGARAAVWLDLLGDSGLVCGVTRGWEPWITEAPPWHDVTTWRDRSSVALRTFVPGATDTPRAATVLHESPCAAADRIVARLDELVTCQALLDNPDAGLALAPFFLHQAPGLHAARAAAAHLRTESRPLASDVDAAIARVVTDGIEVLAAAGPDETGQCWTALTREAVDILGAVTGRIAAAPAGSPDEATAWADCDRLVATMEQAAARTSAGLPCQGRA